MMNLYIKIKDGQPFEHPILEENLLEAFPGIDVNNLPEDVMRFEQTGAPARGPYDNQPTVEYVIEDGVVKEKWTMTSISEEAKQAKIDFAKYMMPHFPSWIFDETLCRWVPPVPRPEGNYVWDERVQNWVERPI